MELSSSKIKEFLIFREIELCCLIFFIFSRELSELKKKTKQNKTKQKIKKTNKQTNKKNILKKLYFRHGTS